MSAKDLIRDAKYLWDDGRKSSAFALILIAFAATARLRYPKPMQDSKAFKRFILDELPTIIGTGDTESFSLPFNGAPMRVEDILYRELRCQLIHEGELPDTINFTPRVYRDGAYYDVIKNDEPFGMPEAWLHNMARAVMKAPENASG